MLEVMVQDATIHHPQGMGHLTCSLGAGPEEMIQSHHWITSAQGGKSRMTNVRSFFPSANHDTTLRFLTSIFMPFTLPPHPLLICNTLKYSRPLVWFPSILNPACLGILIVDQIFCAYFDHPVYYLDIAISVRINFSDWAIRTHKSTEKHQPNFTVERANAPSCV